MRYDLDEIGIKVSYDNVENKLIEIISEKIKVPKEEVIIPPAGCVYEDDFLACNFVVDKIPGAIVVTHEDHPQEREMILKHGVMFYKCNKKQ